MEDNPQPPPARPPNPPGSYDTRMMLIRRYWYLTLKFTSPVVSDSGRWEASWNGGRVEGITEPEMLNRLLEVFQDCGDPHHQWQNTSEIIDRAGSGNVVLIQRCVCAYCDPKERRIVIHRPDLITTQDTAATITRAAAAGPPPPGPTARSAAEELAARFIP